MQSRTRTVTTASGATAVQIIYSYAGGATSMEHVGSAHTDAELAALKAEAARRLQGDQLELGLDLDVTDLPTARGTGTEERPWEVTAGLSYVPGGKTGELPYPIWKWRNDNPGVGYTHDQIRVTNDPGNPGKGIDESLR